MFAGLSKLMGLFYLTLFTEIKTLIQKDRKLQLLLLSMLLVQLITCISQLGFYQPDQHFQIIEFSSYQLKQPSSAQRVWEFAASIRPTLQVYLFSAYISFCQLLTIHDPYVQLTILRISTGLVLFCFFTLMVFYYFRNANRKILYSVLFILNFSWVFPYTRTLFNSEMISSLFFFGTLLLYDWKKDKEQKFFFNFLIGFLFSVAFYFRFQMGFAIAGFGFWMLLFEKKYNRIFPIATGFLIGVLLNTYLDYEFYHTLVFTPYKYFYVNITEGKAASFGTSSFLVYLAVLMAVATAPPLSIVLFYYGVKASLKKYQHPIFITVVFFIIGHCFVAHKEERFLFPIFNILPVLIGWGIPDFINYYHHCKKRVKYFLKSILVFSIVLNSILLVFVLFFPYSQSVQFTYLLKNKFSAAPVTIYCLSRNPFEIQSGSPVTFYQRSEANLNFIKLNRKDSLLHLAKNSYVAITFNQIKEDRALFDSLGYKPVLFSSKLVWYLNSFLHSKKINTINDIWVLYKKE